MCAHIEPGDAAPKNLHTKLALLEIFHVEVCDFQLASRGRLQRSSQIHYLSVVKIKTSHSIRGLGFGRLFFDAKCAPAVVELHHAITLRIVNAISEDRRAGSRHGCMLKQLGKALPVENVIAESKCGSFAVDEPPSYQKGLSQTVGTWLNLVRNVQTPRGAVPEQVLETRLIPWRSDDENIANPGQHQRCERVVDH